MNHIVDTLLTAGRTAIDHDSLLVTKIGFAIVALCVLVLICTVWVLARRRQLQDRPAP
jgi:large-conductance mechanosensitive channel